MAREHVILCGLGRVGRRVLDYLRAAGVPVVAIDTKLTPEDEAQPPGEVRFLKGDFRRRELLDQAGLAQSRGVLILTSDDLVNLSTLMTVLHARPGLRVVVRMFNPTLVARLGEVTKNVFALSTSALTAPMLALIAHSGNALAAFELDADHPTLVTQWTVPDDAGRSLQNWEADTGVKVVARGRADGERVFFSELDPKQPILAGDQLVICGPSESIQHLTGQSSETFGGDSKRGSWRRIGRMLRRVVAEIDLPVKICAGVLLTVIATSVLVFHLALKEETLIEAFYRTISLMATGGEMRGGEVGNDSWIKVYIGGLRMVGTLLTAAFTAILTNYLVRAHLGGALDVRRIPDSGHVIVTGLGNVGFRVVEELIRLGEQVVAIERTRDNPFITTARRLGAAVIIGDAVVAEVLRQAHAGSAKSILAATQNELTNLETALLVRELHPHARVMVRLTDPQLARLLREAADIKLALSIPELAAPAFLAAFLGDRIRTVLLAEGQLMAVVDLVVEANDRLVAQPLAAVALEFRLLPLALTRGEKLRQTDLANTTLTAHDIVTALIAFRDLHKLFERDLPRG